MFFGRRTFWLAIALLVCVFTAVVGTNLWKLRAAADVKEFTPADVDAMLWIPRVDEFAESLFSFTRGVQEAARLRDLLKPELGVELGDADGIRRAGIDPEAGLVVFSRAGMVHILFGVEDSEAITEALKSKFVNLGYPLPEIVPATDALPETIVVSKDSGDPHAAFVVQDGLLVLVYRGDGTDPVAAAQGVHNRSTETQGFFESERFQSIESKLGDKGPMLYADASTFALDSAGNVKLGWFDRLNLPGPVQLFVRSQLAAWMSRVGYAAARISVDSCQGSIKGTLHADNKVQLIPAEWLLPTDSKSPEFGKWLPRDTVIMARLGFNVSAANALIAKLAKLGTGFTQIGRIFGVGGAGVDPVAGFLGARVHQELADLHVVNDLLSHFKGHMAVALVGLSLRSQVSDILRFGTDIRRWLNAVSLVGLFEISKPKELLLKWWNKRHLLEKAGYQLKQIEHESWLILNLKRGCENSSGGICEEYGLVLKDNVLVATTGAAALDRVLNVLRGKAVDYRGLTREKTAIDVLEETPMLLGTYFSFDGLLRAVRNRNLPGGATRYLAQFYELATTLKTADGSIDAELLLTR